MKICVYGMGNVGLATASYLTQAGHDIVLTGRGKHACDAERIMVDYADSVEPPKDEKRDIIEVRVTPDLECAMEDAELVLLALSAQAHGTVGGNFSTYLSEDVPIILFPGKFASSYLLRKGVEGDYRIGEVSSSIFYAKQPEADDLDGATYGVRIMNKKRALGYAGLREDDNEEIVRMLNELFGEGSFVDGVSPFCVALQNNDSTINAVSVIANENVVNCLANDQVVRRISGGSTEGGIELSVYGALSGFAAERMEEIYEVRRQIAEKLGHKLSDLKTWLMRVDENNDGDMEVEEMLFNTYGKKTIRVDDLYGDRRLVEDIPFGLVPLEALAKKLDIGADPVTRTIDRGNAVWHRGQAKAGNQPSNGDHFRDVGCGFDDFSVELDMAIRVRVQ
ncbi:MAG: NAD/NADP octopine/nopaline dehydrogenase family protein [Candidatus Woesearchaeota archaeon]|jgi:opine dehydrogenase|nr:NAD/NADP octopine/nopaline dehydrogenase family protein [Candidatus Woesearchaeota archaeon]MDP7180513.1 NAD/NADP octopine/nopaline dehydrogenase family protein [Candidatus Woesearchaeota archaeon]